MTDNELRELAQSITEQSQLEPITIMPDGRVLDGRNRWLACQIAGIEPKTTVYDGADPVRFVLAKNHRRRHLSFDERAFIAARLHNIQHGHNQHKEKLSTGPCTIQGPLLKPITYREAAEEFNISENAVSEAAAVLKHGLPHIEALIRQNKVGLQNAAAAVVGTSKEVQATWQTGDDIRAAKRAKQAGGRIAEPKPIPTSRPRRISAWDIARPDGGFRSLSQEERGAPPPEIAHEQAPGEPNGVTRLEAHIRKHGHVQLWSPAEKERIEAGLRFTELRGHLGALADPANVPDPASIYDCLNPRTVYNHHAIWDRTLDAAIANLLAFRDAYREKLGEAAVSAARPHVAS